MSKTIADLKEGDEAEITQIFQNVLTPKYLSLGLRPMQKIRLVKKSDRLQTYCIEVGTLKLGLLKSEALNINIK